MPVRFVCPLLLAILAAAQSPTPAVSPAATPNIAGVWVLNPSLTQRPAEIGFSPEWARAGEDAAGRSSGGGRGRRGGSGSGSSSGGVGTPAISHESADDSIRVQQLTGEARTPPAHLTIIQKADTVSIADDQGHTRTFRPDGKLEELTIGTIALPTTARWDTGSLVVLYDVERGRQLRYTYTPSANPARLQIDIRFLERGRDGDEVRLGYESPDAHDLAVLSGTAPPADAATAARPSAPSAVPEPTPPSARPPVLPPGSELRGLTTIGTVVESLTASAATCGLDQTKIKTTIARILADAGFKTQPDGNEESYVLVSVVTSKLPDGGCVSRYDASLVSEGDATFPYLKGLVAIEVPLLHQGGIAGGSPAQHATGVMDALTKSVNGFVTQIRAANK